MSKMMTEEEIHAKYENVQKGSLTYVDEALIQTLRDAGEVERAESLSKYVGKQVVNRRCEQSKRLFVCATQDLWQSTLHPDKRGKKKAKSKAPVDVEAEVAAAKAAGKSKTEAA